MDSAGKVALITGCTSGIGLGLAEKLVKEHRHLHICLSGRNEEKLKSVLSVLKLKYPNSNLSMLVLDVSDSKSVLNAVREIRNRFNRLDFIFLNAGMMPETRINWMNVVKGLFNGKIIHMFLTGDGMLEALPEKKTRDGLSLTFATNVFGHFVLVSELQDILGRTAAGDYTHLIWTSSSSANSLNCFDKSDVMCLNGKQSYASSKYCMDALSISLNENWNSKGIYSSVVCPGVVWSSMTGALLPAWVWYLMMPLFFLLRVFIRNLTLTLDAATSGLVWLTHQQPESLDYHQKIYTRASWFGSYLDFHKIKVEEETKNDIWKQMSQLRSRITQRLKNV
ncbi:hypothetical protein RvY_09191 [Ramazzottius varieornatus]|uniref:3-keto-steroid reductase n=1 Tax=Ramazzottius varieornatus TaxID=947166 RepID=A0A1D1V8F5_RAMVA|nr:hypothetical protein RvY_09191 [Ramazzottius varieornatus]